MSVTPQPTPRNVRTELSDLRLGAASPLAGADQPTVKGTLLRCYNNATLFLAGMYTGVKCSGIPRAHGDSESQRDNGPV